MDVFIVGIDGAGQQVNRFKEPVIACEARCGALTTMLGTRLCDRCWEAQRRLSWNGASSDARNALVA